MHGSPGTVAGPWPAISKELAGRTLIVDQKA
jgi:hypothetical protein